MQLLKRRGLAQGCAFWGLKNLKLIFNVFIRKSRRNYNGAYMGVGTGGAEGAAAPPTFGTGEQAIALAPPKV